MLIVSKVFSMRQMRSSPTTMEKPGDIHQNLSFWPRSVAATYRDQGVSNLQLIQFETTCLLQQVRDASERTSSFKEWNDAHLAKWMSIFSYINTKYISSRNANHVQQVIQSVNPFPISSRIRNMYCISVIKP